MTNVLAIASVTQLLKDLLNEALINGEVSDVLGADFTVTALPPDRVVSDAADTQVTQLNVFLHGVTPNAALRNSDLPTRDAEGRLTCRPRMALDLHYMVTAVSAEELHAEILLGYAMQLFHENALLPRERIRNALTVLPVSGDILPDNLGVIMSSGIADQIELLKITPRTLSMDDMSKMWTALQASYRTSVAYDVSVVLMERELPTRPALPVLSRGGLVDPVTGRDPGVSVQPGLALGVPTLLAVLPQDGQPVMRLGRTVALEGFALSGAETEVRFTEVGSGTVLRLAPRDPADPAQLLVDLPGGAPMAAGDALEGTASDPGAWRIGTYTVEVSVLDTAGREAVSNGLAVTLAPDSAAAAAAVVGGTAITMDCAPVIRAGQSVAVLAGTAMEQVATPVAATAQVSAVFSGLVPGQPVAVRLRVAGIDSPVIDRGVDPPALVTVMVP